jgi:hypothetical protein
MGRFDKLAKYLGLAAEKYGDDAAKILKKVDSPELAVDLPPTERGEYIQALTEIYGDAAKRRELTRRTVKGFHGTSKRVDELDPNISKRSLLGKGTYITSDPEYANLYTNNETGNIMPVYLKEGKYLNINEDEGLSKELINKLVEKMGKDKYPPSRLKKIKQYLKMLENKDQEIGLLNSIYDGDVVKLGQDLSKEGILGKQHSGVLGDHNSYRNIIFKVKPAALNEQTATVIKDPVNMRSQFAAFDPRFDDSPLLMAGGLAAPAASLNVNMNPLEDIKKGLGYYEQAKEAVTKPLAQQLNISKNPEDEAAFNTILKAGLDPINAVPGAAGLGLGVVQMLTPSEEEMRINALKKLSGKGS